MIRSDSSGAASVEFALILPLLLVLGLYGSEVANMTVANLQVSQMALSVADNASRLGQTDNSGVTPTITESDVDGVLYGALQQGASLGFATKGRVILTSLEKDMATGKQYIHWQRCIGNLSVQSAYGNDTTHTGLTGAAITGMGSGTTKVAAPAASNNQAVMFVELYYTYNGLFGTMFLKPQRFANEAAFITRDSRNLPAGLTGTNTTRCT